MDGQMVSSRPAPIRSVRTPMAKDANTVPSRFPTPPSTTTMKQPTMYDPPTLGPTEPAAQCWPWSVLAAGRDHTRFRTRQRAKVHGFGRDGCGSGNGRVELRMTGRVAARGVYLRRQAAPTLCLGSGRHENRPPASGDTDHLQSSRAQPRPPELNPESGESRMQPTAHQQTVALPRARQLQAVAAAEEVGEERRGVSHRRVRRLPPRTTDSATCGSR